MCVIIIWDAEKDSVVNNTLTGTLGGLIEKLRQNGKNPIKCKIAIFDL